jgi:vesicle-fusing ATPase
VNDQYVFTARPLQGFPAGQIGMNDPQRTWAGVAFTDVVRVSLFDMFSQGGQTDLATMDVEVGFAGKKSTEAPYDQDELQKLFIKVNSNIPYHPCMYATLILLEFPISNILAGPESFDG